jgi:hypothetical protein
VIIKKNISFILLLGEVRRRLKTTRNEAESSKEKKRKML